MIAWFGPAMLILLLTAVQLSDTGSGSGSAVAAVFGEETGVAVACPDSLETPAESEGRTCAAPLPRPLSRCRSVQDYGLPAPRAPTC